MKKDVLRNLTKFTGKHLWQSLLFNKGVACNFIKKRLWHKSFLVNFLEFLRTPFLQNTSGRLLLPFVCLFDYFFFGGRFWFLSVLTLIE